MQPPPASAARPEPSRAADRLPSLLIVGNDAVIAARPATAVQLAHAALRAGFDGVIPASWGDELVAAASARAVAERGTAPAVFCACPHVAQRMLAAGPELGPFLVSVVPPPVALARYLRASHMPHGVRLTYAGRCPGAQSEAYDARIAPDELLRLLADRGISPAAEPEAFDSVIPPDRRRFESLPGGVPASGSLRAAGSLHTVVELSSDDIVAELAQHLLDGAPALVDGAVALGCACAGVTADSMADARQTLVALEPPRAARPIVDVSRVPVAELMLPLPVASRDVADIVAAIARRRDARAPRADAADVRQPPRRTSGERAVERLVDTGADAPLRRRSPAGGTPLVRPPSSVGPTARSTDGRLLPRAYVARRRSGGRPLSDDGADEGEE